MKKRLFLSICIAAHSIWAVEITVDATQGQAIQAALDQAKPGDTIIVKPGLYPETVTFKTSGELGKPITLKAEKPGTALIDGTGPITGWQKVAKAADVADAPNWNHLYYVEVPTDRNYGNLGLQEDDQHASFAQYPVPADPFYYDDPAGFKPVDPKTHTAMTITDPEIFNQKDPSNWDGAAVIVMTSQLNHRFVRTFEPEHHRIVYSQCADGTINPTADRYALVNHLHLITQPGQYVVKKNPATGANTLYYWPRDAKNLENGKTRRPLLKNGILATGTSHIAIEGFDLRGHAGSAIAVSDATNVVIRNNHVYNAAHGDAAISLPNCHDTTIDANHVHHIQGGRGIAVTGTSRTPVKNTAITNNRISHCGSHAIHLLSLEGGKILNNLVFENSRAGATGVTAYQGCSDIQYEGNTIMRSGVALNMQHGNNITIRDNYLEGNGAETGQHVTVVSHHTTLTNVIVENNIVNGAQSSFHIAAESSDWRIKNNVLAGINIWTKQNEGGVVLENNIITQKGNPERDEAYAAKNTYETDLAKIFVNAEKGDFHRVKGSSLPEAGLLNGGRKIDLHPGSWAGRSAK